MIILSSFFFIVIFRSLAAFSLLFGGYKFPANAFWIVSSFINKILPAAKSYITFVLNYHVVISPDGS